MRMIDELGQRPSSSSSSMGGPTPSSSSSCGSKATSKAGAAASLLREGPRVDMVDCLVVDVSRTLLPAHSSSQQTRLRDHGAVVWM